MFQYCSSETTSFFQTSPPLLTSLRHGCTMMLTVGLLLLGCVASTIALPTGAPASTCIDLTPQHGTAQLPPSPYSLDLSAFAIPNMTGLYFEPGLTYTSERWVDDWIPIAYKYTLSSLIPRPHTSLGTRLYLKVTKWLNFEPVFAVCDATYICVTLGKNEASCTCAIQAGGYNQSLSMRVRHARGIFLKVNLPCMLAALAYQHCGCHLNELAIQQL